MKIKKSDPGERYGLSFYDLEREIKDMRKFGLGRIDDAEELLNRMGCPETRSFSEKVSKLLTLIQALSDCKVDAELLLMALGLLQGYGDIPDIGERRLTYYRNAYPEDESDDPKSWLYKKEEPIIEKFVVKILTTQNLPSLIAGAPRKPILPSPQYPDKARWANVGRTLFRNLDFPHKNAYFAGRERILEQLADGFAADTQLCVQTLCGLGGVGKTQIALEYAHRYKEIAYDTVWRVVSDNEESIRKDIAEFAERRGLAGEADSIQTKLGAFVEWLEKHTAWLLIFDNVDDMELIKSYMPHKCDSGGHILITTRLTGEGLINPVCVDVFDKKAAKAFLSARLNGSGKDRDGLETLAERLGYLPLALEQAAAYINVKLNGDVAGYLARLEKHGLRVFKDYKNSINVVWKISVEKITESARQLLYLCSYFAPDAIDLAFFVARAEALAAEFEVDDGGAFRRLPKELSRALLDEIERDSLIAEVTRFSLMKYDFESNTLSMHRLLQEVIREEAKADLRYLLGSLLMVYDVARISDEANLTEQLRRNLPHVCSIMRFAEPIFQDNEVFAEMASTLYRFAELSLRLLGDQGQANVYRAKSVFYGDKLRLNAV